MKKFYINYKLLSVRSDTYVCRTWSNISDSIERIKNDLDFLYQKEDDYSMPDYMVKDIVKCHKQEYIDNLFLMADDIQPYHIEFGNDPTAFRNFIDSCRIIISNPDNETQRIATLLLLDGFLKETNSSFGPFRIRRNSGIEKG